MTTDPGAGAERAPGRLRVALAVDPGRDKCGVAAVDSIGTVVLRRIVPAADVVAAVHGAAETCGPDVVLVGDGTGSKPVVAALEAAGLAVPVRTVDEAHTSEEARRRCVAATPRAGWRRFLPASLVVPDGPYDDWVAVILAERWWRGGSHHRAPETPGSSAKG